MAEELGASPKTARRAALLHDIGKAVTHEIEGPHALVGGDLARKYGETEAVAHAMEAHHNEVEPQTVEAVIVQAADALSGARPGARGESLEQYVKRLRDLEQIASPPRRRRQGLRDAGRARDPGHGRPRRIDDDAATLLSYAIAREIEKDLETPPDQGDGHPRIPGGRIRPFFSRPRFQSAPVNWVVRRCESDLITAGCALTRGPAEERVLDGSTPLAGWRSARSVRTAAPLLITLAAFAAHRSRSRSRKAPPAHGQLLKLGTPARQYEHEQQLVRVQPGCGRKEQHAVQLDHG